MRMEETACGMAHTMLGGSENCITVTTEAEGMRLRNRHLIKSWKRKQEAYKARLKDEAAAAAKKK